jgi:transposase-like protein
MEEGRMNLSSSAPFRIGYMAGREISVREIAEQFGCSPALILNALRIAGITPAADRGPVLLVSVPMQQFVEAIDVVGRKMKMSRDQVAEATLLSILRAGPEAIEDALIRGGFSG